MRTYLRQSWDDGLVGAAVPQQVLVQRELHMIPTHARCGFPMKDVTATISDEQQPIHQAWLCRRCGALFVLPEQPAKYIVLKIEGVSNAGIDNAAG